MLTVSLGNFHPDLEEALCKNILSLRSEDPLAPVGVIVPSGRLRSRIKFLLTVERGMDLMGIHFLTFHNLTLKLYEEQYGLVRHLEQDDFFYIEFLRHTLRTDLPGAEKFRKFADTPEGCAALWSTLQDLRDARVDPDSVIEAIREGIFSEEDLEKITPLILLYKGFLLRKKEFDFIDYADLPEIASEFVSSSEYLQAFREIIYYGFYDLTQVQYDLFRSIVQHYPASLYFPFVQGMPAFSFAKRFFEGYIQGLVQRPECVHRLSEPVVTGPPGSTVFPFGHLSSVVSTSGAEDEVMAVAKGILQLVDREGYSFSDIGVAAREIGDYAPLIKRIFGSHRIPFVSSAGEPVVRYPVTKTVHLLISILDENFRRSDIIDLASSHSCKTRSFCPDGIEPRPDIWDMITRNIGISRGIEEWHKLDRYIQNGFTVRGDEEEEGVGRVIPGIEIEGLKRFVLSLETDFLALPEVSSWGDYVERVLALIGKYMETEDFIQEALLSLKVFDRISNEVPLREFLETFKRGLDSKSLPMGDDNIAGVQVLDAMAARGIPFKVLFILGMNEKVFPRNIQEDPFLRDSARGVLERGLGYKITEKLYGYEEEKLLFYLLLSSARERVCLFYQRTDESGQVRVPSWYLSEMRRGYPVQETRVPRRMVDKFSSSEFFDCPLLTPKELAIRNIFEGKDPDPVMSGFNLPPGLYKQGVKSVRLRERMTSGLTGFDGITGPIGHHWDRITRKGSSPTSLEGFARCPFSYFARHILHLKRLERPDAISELPPSDIGNICHKVLKRFYGRGADLIRPDRDIKRFLEEDSSEVFHQFQQTNPVGYPLLWEMLQGRLVTLLGSMISWDLSEMASAGFIPHSLEVDAAGYFTQDLPDYMREIFVHGVLDRIDIKPGTGIFRVIDYKFKSGKRADSDDGNLPLSAVRGKRLQPPLYLLMAVPYLRYTAGIENPVPEKASFYFIAPNWSAGDGEKSRSEFPGDCWQSPLGDRIKETVGLLLKGIREGIFFIYPGGYCDYCDYASICRKNHFPSHWRAETDERVKPFHQIRHYKL